MKTKIKTQLMRSICTVCLSAMLATTAYAAPASEGDDTTTNASETSETISPQSDVLRWYYKEENGKIYKRLYNASTKNWIGDWIYVCDLN